MPFLWKKRLLIPVIIVLGGIALGALSLATVSSGFVTRKLAAQIEESAAAKTDIGGATVRPFSGEIELEDVKITKVEEGTTFEFSVGHVEAKVSVRKLIFRQLDFVSVCVEKPQVTIVRTREDAPPSLLKNSLKQFTVPQPKEGEGEQEQEFDFVIHDLSIRDGSLIYKESREDAEAMVELRKLKYHASEVSISRFYRLLLGANIEGELVAGGGKGSFKKVHAPGVSSICIKDMDMTCLNSCIVPADVFVISNGVMSASADMLSGGSVIVHVAIAGLKVSENPDSPGKTLLFIPVKKIVDYVNRKGGNFDLRFALSGEGWHTSEDLDELIAGFWQDLWADIMGEEFAQGAAVLRKILSR
jgi:hypothetical protein